MNNRMLRGLLMVSLVGLLSACVGKTLTHNNFRFDRAKVQTPLGELKITFKGTHRKLSSREWVSESPWRLVLGLRDNSVTSNNCAASIQNFSLQGEDGSKVTILSADQELVEPIKKHSDADSVHEAIWIIMDKEFSHQNYQLTLMLSTQGDCEKNIAKHTVQAQMTSQHSIDKSSMWDALMGI